MLRAQERKRSSDCVVPKRRADQKPQYRWPFRWSAVLKPNGLDFICTLDWYWNYFHRRRIGILYCRPYCFCLHEHEWPILAEGSLLKASNFQCETWTSSTINLAFSLNDFTGWVKDYKRWFRFWAYKVQRKQDLLKHNLQLDLEVLRRLVVRNSREHGSRGCQFEFRAKDRKDGVAPESWTLPLKLVYYCRFTSLRQSKCTSLLPTRQQWKPSHYIPCLIDLRPVLPNFCWFKSAYT